MRGNVAHSLRCYPTYTTGRVDEDLQKVIDQAERLAGLDGMGWQEWLQEGMAIAANAPAHRAPSQKALRDMVRRCVVVKL